MGEEQSLRQKTAKGLFWGGLSNSLQQLLGLLFGIVLARLLSRSDYGMIGMLTIFSTIANILQESGFISALVNRKNASDKDYNAVFWFSVSCSAILYILLYLSAPLIAEFYRTPELVPLSRLTFLSFFIASFRDRSTRHPFPQPQSERKYDYFPFLTYIIRYYSNSPCRKWICLLGHSHTITCIRSSCRYTQLVLRQMDA